MEKIFTIKNLDELEALSKELQPEIFNDSKKYQNQIFFFEAQMGSGKTTFIRTLVQKFNPNLKVSSPTFTGMHHYEDKDLDFYHYDLYQVALSLEEFQDILSLDKKKLIFFEWAEKLDENTKTSMSNENTKAYKFKIDVNDNEVRTIFLES